MPFDAAAPASTTRDTGHDGRPNALHVRIADLRSNKRPRAIAHPRQVAMYLCRELTTSSLTDIAQSFGGKDHTTVLYACRKIEQVKEQDEMVNQQLHALKRRLGSNEERCEQPL